MGKVHRQSRAFVALAILLACCSCAFALDPSLDINQYAHTAWKIRDGFSMAKPATRLCRKIAMKPPTGFRPTTRPFESMDAGRSTQPEQVCEPLDKPRSSRETSATAESALGSGITPKSPLYSCLNASIGCTPAARRAGIQLAAKATASKVNTPPIIVAGSHG
jgi:hypothetical protein